MELERVVEVAGKIIPIDEMLVAVVEDNVVKYIEYADELVETHGKRKVKQYERKPEYPTTVFIEFAK